MDSGITPLTPAQEQVQEQQTAAEGYVRRNEVALDMLADTLTDGKNDQTLSSRWAAAAERGNIFAKIAMHLLNLVSPNHGAKAVAGDLERAQAEVKITANDPAK